MTKMRGISVTSRLREPMKFSENYDYPTTFATTWQMYLDPEFTKNRLKEGKFDDLEINVSEDGPTLTIVAKGNLSPEALPAQASRFVKGGVKMQVTQVWTKSGDNTAMGTMEVVATGAPVKISANCGLTEDAGRTAVTMEGDLRVSVPLLGARIEKEAMRFVPVLIDGDQAAATEWLAAH